MYKSFFVLFAIALVSISLTSSKVIASVSKSPECVGNLTCLQFRVGPAVLVEGPRTDIPDSPFISNIVYNGVRAYTGNWNTYSFFGNSVETLTLVKDGNNNPMPVIGAGSPNTFDEHGAWLIGTNSSSTFLRGWYHAEQGANVKSIAYAESYDNGITFVKPNYPYNQVLTSAPGSIKGEGDASVVFLGNYYYMYFLHDNSTRGVARSYWTSYGLPGTWYKFYNGSFSQPGLGGQFTPLNTVGSDIGQSGSASHLSIIGDSVVYGVAFIGTDSNSIKGLKLSFASNGVNFTNMAL